MKGTIVSYREFRAVIEMQKPREMGTWCTIVNSTYVLLMRCGDVVLLWGDVLMGTRVSVFDRLLPSDSVVARKDPVWFATRLLGVDPWSKQAEILTALRDHDYVAVRSCNGSGKTFTAAMAALWWLVAHEQAVVITTAPSERQVRQLLWREIRGLHSARSRFIGGKLTATRLEFSDKRFAFGFSTNTAERFQGFHNENILTIVDEASGVHESIFDAISGCLTSENAKMLMIGNPMSLAGTFYDAFHKNRDNWKTIHISAFDTPAFHKDDTKGDTKDAEPNHPLGMVTPKWARRFAKERGENSSAYQVRVLGEFPDEADDTLIPLKLIEAAVGRDFEDIDKHEPLMGVDIARFGNSQTVAIVRRGPQVLKMVAFGRSNLMQTTGRIIDIARNHGVSTIYIDEVGLGAGVIDRAKEIDSVRPVGINGGSRPGDTERYLNLRAQMFDGLRQRFVDSDIAIPDDAELISQLASLTFKYTSRGQLQLESKDQIRSSGRQSPDKADALALAFTSAPNPMRMWVLSSNTTQGGRRRRRGRRLD